MPEQSRPALRLGVLISGRGSNLQSIIDNIERGQLKATIEIVISNRADAPGLARAQRHGLRTMVIEHRSFASREAFDHEMAQVLVEAGVELVACAGFMRLFSPVMLRAFPNRIMNIHPALLPAFPGIHVQKAALDYGVRFAGCTVFFVAEGTDDGPIIIQAVVPVYDTDSEETLSERILAQEHLIYPEAISLYQQGRLKLVGRRVLIDGGAPHIEGTMINPPLRRHS